MKKMKKTVTPKRLHLAKETVRILRDREMHHVGGGSHVVSVCIGCNT